MKYILFVISLVFTLSVSAKNRTEAEMRSLAYDVLHKAMNGESARAKAKLVDSFSADDLTLQQDSKAYSVFTKGNTGFVILSKDADTDPVLGYSVSNAFSKMPPALQFYLDAYDAGMVTQSISRSTVAVAPMVTTTWGQDAPYNNLCPQINGKTTPCGCGATALSQILNFVQQPTVFSFSSTYYVGDETNVNTVSVKDTVSYPFLDKYEKGSYTEAQGTAVATFVRDCGYAINMTYSTSGSGAYDNAVMTAATARFGFPKESVKMYNKTLYSDTEWDNIIFNELQRGFPIYYTGANSQGEDGHAFVVCGCDEEGRVYVNWGWDGDYDGYYSMDLMAPRKYDFSYYSGTVQGFHPTKLETDTTEIVFGSPELYTFSTTATGGFQLTLPEGLWNYSNKSYTVAICVCAENEATGAKKYATVSRQGTYAVYYGQGEGDYPFAMNNLAEGKYRLSLMVKKQNTTLYYPVRTKGGFVHYEMTVDSSGKITIGTDPIADGICAVNIDEPVVKSSKQYNLSGQQITGNYHGIVIQNGKKVLK